MLRSMIALAKMQFQQYNIYKSNFYLFTLNRIVEIIVYIFVWQAIYNQTGDAGGFTITQMITYYILVVTISSIAIWGINEDIAHSIRNGQINKELLNPITYFQYYFGVNLGELSFAVVIRDSYFYNLLNILGHLFASKHIKFYFIYNNNYSWNTNYILFANDSWNCRVL